MTGSGRSRRFCVHVPDICLRHRRVGAWAILARSDDVDHFRGEVTALGRALVICAGNDG